MESAPRLAIGLNSRCRLNSSQASDAFSTKTSPTAADNPAPLTRANYRVFNLAVAHELARFGCKQGEVVELVADIQSELKCAFDRANAGPELFGNMDSMERDATDADEPESDSGARVKSYLALRRVEATESAVAYFGGAVQAGARLSQKEILDGPDKLNRFLAEQLQDGLFAVFVMELSKLAVGIMELMPLAPLRKRGRPTSVPPSNWSDVVDQFQVRERGHGR
jgi:hypothetical protein